MKPKEIVQQVRLCFNEQEQDKMCIGEETDNIQLSKLILSRIPAALAWVQNFVSNASRTAIPDIDFLSSNLIEDETKDIPIPKHATPFFYYLAFLTLSAYGDQRATMMYNVAKTFYHKDPPTVAAPTAIPKQPTATVQ